MNKLIKSKGEERRRSSMNITFHLDLLIKLVFSFLFLSLKNAKISCYHTFYVSGFLEETVDIQSSIEFQRFVFFVVSIGQHRDDLFAWGVHFQKALKAGNDRLFAHLRELVAGLKSVLVLAISAEASLDGFLFLGVADRG